MDEKIKSKTKTAASKKAAASKTSAKKASKPQVAQMDGIIAEGAEVLLPTGYTPSDDEEFMNPLQAEYFRQKLLKWQQELLSEANSTLSDLSEENLKKPDVTDRAQAESDAALRLRTRDRERKLLSKIESALQRLDLGTYGYCEETGEPIGIKRLEARPVASLSVEAQERHERMERTQRDD